MVTVLWRGRYPMLGYHHQPGWGPQKGTLEGTSWRSMWQLPCGGLPGGSHHSPVLPTTRLLSLHTTSSIQNADTALTSEIPFFFSFAYFQIGAQHRESERDGVKEGWRVCRGGLFLGLTFGHSRGLSQVRPKDSITPCLHLCPCLQGTVLRAQRAQLTACEQRSSLAFMRSLGLFLLLQTSEWFLICRLLTSTQPDRKGNYADGGVLREVNLTFP